MSQEKNPFIEELWYSDPEYMDIFKTIKFTLVDHSRCYLLFKLAKNVTRFPGDVAEVGVYQGGTARFLCQTFSPFNKITYLFDTFEGLPEVNLQKDTQHRKGDFSDTSMELVIDQLKGLKHFHIYKGLFPDTSKPIEDKKFCFVHIDVDIYEPTKDCCEFFYNRMVNGGIMVFDDYGWAGCPGVKAAVDEFFADKYEEVVYAGNGNAFVIKTPRHIIFKYLVRKYLKKFF